MPKAVIALVLTCVSLTCAAPASSSELIDRDGRGVSLSVDAQGRALVSYRARGRAWHVLASGATDARHPTSGKLQVRFRKDYSGRAWTSFKGGCRAYDGPRLAFLVAACAAPDGSYWALQSWQRALPDLGMVPWLPIQRTIELHLSHWSGPVAILEAWTDWIYGGRFHHLFGRLTYDGRPVYGFNATSMGSPKDAYGRNIYLDTLNSRYGKGWRRENAFLAHNPTGVFCYGFYAFDPTKGYAHPRGFPNAPRGPGTGEAYRLTVIGPGVTPDVSITVPGLHDYDSRNPADIEYEQQRNAQLDSIVGVDKLCRRH